ncbi:MAG: recombinase family protein, partial [Betaproteobacteria bacterium]|nr:recombinase family protein [Betaproteobacteria bacterium]
MNKYYAYIRVSTAKQGERGSSLQEQRSAIEGYAKRNALEIAEWFEEMETAAKRGRRLFAQMLKLLKSQRARGVIIHKIDRSARNLRDWADLGELIDSGVEVHFAHESLDLHSRGGRLSADIQAVVAADYIRNLRDEVIKGFVGRLKQGLFPLPAPLGYRDQGSGLPKIPDPRMAPIVRRAFELYATGRFNLDTLGAELYALGLRNRTGKRISDAGLSWALNNPFYIGLIRVKRTGETYQGVHEPLITKRLFDQVQAVLRSRTKNQGLKHEFLFRRFLRCVHCGYRLIGELQKGHTYYRCQTKGCPRTCLREEVVSAQIDAALSSIKVEPHELEALREECFLIVSESDVSLEQSATAMRLSISQADDRIRRLTDAYIDRLIDKDLFEERKTALLQERLQLQERLDDVLAGQPKLAANVNEFLELVGSLVGKENPANPAENRDLLEKATSNRGIDQKNLVYSWKPQYTVLAAREEFMLGAPYQGGSRTCCKRSTRRRRAQGRRRCARCRYY